MPWLAAPEALTFTHIPGSVVGGEGRSDTSHFRFHLHSQLSIRVVRIGQLGAART